MNTITINKANNGFVVSIQRNEFDNHMEMFQGENLSNFASAISSAMEEKDPLLNPVKEKENPHPSVKADPNLHVFPTMKKLIGFLEFTLGE